MNPLAKVLAVEGADEAGLIAKTDEKRGCRSAPVFSIGS